MAKQCRISGRRKSTVKYRSVCLKKSVCGVKRGLYRAASGMLINADVNGSCNIGRKVIQNEVVIQELDRSVAATPVRVNPLKISA